MLQEVLATSSCGHAGMDGSTTSSWSGPHDALTHIQLAGLSLLHAEQQQPPPLVPPSHAAQLCSTPSAVVAAAVQLSAIFSVGALHGALGHTGVNQQLPLLRPPAHQGHMAAALQPPSLLGAAVTDGSCDSVEQVLALAAAMPATSAQAAAVYAAWGSALLELQHTSSAHQLASGLSCSRGQQGETTQPRWLPALEMVLENSAAKEDAQCRWAGVLCTRCHSVHACHFCSIFDARLPSDLLSSATMSLQCMVAHICELVSRPS